MNKPRAITFLDQSGDTTIAWTEDRDEEMLPIIQKKMDEGIVFFIIEPRLGGWLPPKKTELKNAQDAAQHRALSIRDEDFAKFVGSGAGEVIPTPSASATKSRKAKDAKEVASSESVAVKPLKGG